MRWNRRPSTAGILAKIAVVAARTGPVRLAIHIVTVAVYRLFHDGVLEAWSSPRARITILLVIIRPGHWMWLVDGAVFATGVRRVGVALAAVRDTCSYCVAGAVVDMAVAVAMQHVRLHALGKAVPRRAGHH